MANREITARNDKHQSIGLSLSEGIIFAEGAIERAVRDLAKDGFGIIRTMLRNTNLTHRAPEVVDAIARITREAHALGVLVVFDCEPHQAPLGRDIGRQFPKAMSTRVVRAETALVNGYFVLHFDKPGSETGVGETPIVEAAFLKSKTGDVRRINLLNYRVRVEHEVYDNGYVTRDDHYVEGRPARHRMHTRLSGELDEEDGETVIVYAGFPDRERVDFWSPDCRAYYRDLLEAYRGIPLDGIGWDEPGQGGSWSHYLAGEAFFAAFERINGYSLRDRFYLLDEPGTSAEAVKVRLDYYQTLNEGLFQAQRDVIKIARSLFGDDLILGTHHTWQGEGGINDYRAGAVDYYRLGQNMDAGYTDCCWWDAESVAYSYTLGSSLGRLSPTGFTEVNTWHFKPTIASMEYNARLMTLMNIGWFNIWYGEMSDTCLYPAHYSWERTVFEMRRHREAQRLIGRARPVAEIAVLHGWETVAGINRPQIAGAHKTFCLNTASLLLQRNIAFDWLDSGLIAEAGIEDGRLMTPLGRYSVLVLPYASVLPSETWRRCVEFARAGGKLVFTGPPPALDTGGGSLVMEFAELLGTAPLSMERYLQGVEASCHLPSGRPEKLDVFYPLDGPAERRILSPEGELHGLRNAEGNVVYLSELDPRVALIGIIEAWNPPAVVCYAEGILWRLYRDEARTVLVLAARRDRQLVGIVRFEGTEFEFTGGSVALIEHSADGFCIDGENLLYKQRPVFS